MNMEEIEKKISTYQKLLKNEKRKLLEESEIQTIGTEQEILDNLVNAWNAFVKLPATHPMDLGDFCDGIHKCQYVLMAREARRSRPDIYPIKEMEVGEEIPYNDTTKKLLEKRRKLREKINKLKHNSDDKGLTSEDDGDSL